MQGSDRKVPHRTECIFTDLTVVYEIVCKMCIRDSHTGSKEPVVWYQSGELMKNAKNRVKIHTPYIICNDMRDVYKRQTGFGLTQMVLTSHR